MTTTRALELLGVTPNFALFGDGNLDGLTVTINLTSFEVYDPQPRPSTHSSAWGPPDPGLVPTEAFELAESALATAQRITGTDVIVAAASADRRSFAIPKAVQLEAQQALRWQAEHRRGGTEVGMNTARLLARGDSVGINKVRHISRYFEKHAADSTPADDTAVPSEERVSFGLWGGEPAARWAANIVRRSDSLAARNAILLASNPNLEPVPPPAEPAAEPTDDSELGQESAVQSGEETDQPDLELTSEDLDGLVWAADGPHPFMPSIDLGELCEVCMGNQYAISHTDENVGLAAAAAAVTAAAVCDMPLADYFVEVNSDARVTGLYSRSHGEWRGWDLRRTGWLSAAEQSDVIPIDDDSAVTFAQVLAQQEAWPDLIADVSEAQLFADAELPDTPAIPLEEVDFATEMDPETEEVSGLFIVTDDGVCWAWGGNEFGDWEAQDECPSDTTLVDLEVAREIAAEMAPNLDADQIEEAFNRAAYIAAGNNPDEALAIRAAGSNTDTPQDSEYTEDERSKNAAQQFRDARGRFAKVGAVVKSNDGRSGEVTGVNPQNNSVRVRFDNGQVEDVDPKSLTKVGQVQPEATPAAPATPATPATPAKAKEKPKPPTYPKIDYSKIQGQPRAIKGSPKAFLPNLLPPMDPAAIKTVISDYQRFIDQERRRKLEKFAATGPEASDVKPLYLAVVDELDNSAVLDLISLVPSGPGSNELSAFRRTEGGWQQDDDLLRKIQSTSPPALVTLDDPTYQVVLDQVDGFYKQQVKDQAQTASAGYLSPLWSEDGTLLPALLTTGDVMAMTSAATPSGAAAAHRLKTYWLRGKGAAKIRWGTPGDWKRCRQHLTKYMRNAEGYCQELHKEATGVYTGDRRNVGGNGRGRRGLSADGSAMFLQVPARIGNAPQLVDADADAMLVEINQPTAKELASLSGRDYGHRLLAGEKFLVGAADGNYVIRVLGSNDVSGWEGRAAAIVQPYRQPTTVMILEQGEFNG